jgi:hypothetical protein
MKQMQAAAILVLNNVDYLAIPIIIAPEYWMNQHRNTVHAIANNSAWTQIGAGQTACYNAIAHYINIPAPWTEKKFSGLDLPHQYHETAEFL